MKSFYKTINLSVNLLTDNIMFSTMKKILNNRWALLVLGFLFGSFIGADLALRYAGSQKFKYDQMLEDHFIESRIWDLATTEMTLKKAEDGDLDSVLWDHQIMLRGTFLTLVDIHKTGDYPRKNNEMVNSLIRTKEFMAKRPDQFLDMEFAALSAKSFNNPKNEHSESSQVSNHAKNHLQDAFDYVDGLKLHEENGEPTAGENAPRPTA